MAPGPTHGFALVLILFGAALLLELRRRRAQARAIGATAAALGATHEGHTLRGEHGGIRYRCWHTPATRHTPSSVTVAIAAPPSGEFRIARERATHRFWKRLGVDRELSTGDPDFDQDFYVATDTPTRVAAALADPGARAGVAALFQLRCAEVRQAKNELQARWVHVGAGAVDVSILRFAVAHLATLGTALARAPREPSVSAPVDAGSRGLLLLVPVGLGAAAIGALVAGEESAVLDPGRLLVASLRWSLPALGLYLVLAARAVAGRSTSHRELIAAALLALVAFPLAGFSAMRYANLRLDESPPLTHSARVVRTYTTDSQAAPTPSYWAEVKSWRGRGREHIRVSRPEWDRLARTGAPLTVVTHAGGLGFEWIASYRVEAPDV